MTNCPYCLRAQEHYGYEEEGGNKIAREYYCECGAAWKEVFTHSETVMIFYPERISNATMS